MLTNVDKEYDDTLELEVFGASLLNHPRLNKGTAFTKEERDQFGLHGLLPPKISTPKEQISRTYYNFSRRGSALEKYDALIGLLSRNEHLFYQFALQHASEVLPILYTPTVGLAAQEYSRIYFHQRGLYLSYPLMNQLDDIFARLDAPIDAVVVTDGERILGLGDQGIGGMAIPVGKLILYTLFGGLHPSRTLPIILDVGTNNQTLLNDPFYLGWHHPRLSGEMYDEFVDRFVKALKKRFPNALLQWEDFGKSNARKLLERYREDILSFNDDIQGTAAVVLGGLIAAVHKLKQDLKTQKFAIVGAGSAGVGIAETIVRALVQEGLSIEEARLRIYLIDAAGLIHFAGSHITDEQRPFVQPREAFENWIGDLEKITLPDVVKNAKPTILIGVCAQGGIFSKEVIEEMHKNTAHPIIFPLSNPTSKAECTAEEAILWTKGDAMIATGSPFEPVQYEGKQIPISQCNNVYIFPGVALGCIAVKASRVTDGMFLAAARTLAEESLKVSDGSNRLFPKIEEVREVSKKIALEVAKQAIRDQVSSVSEKDAEKFVAANSWDPHYSKYVFKT